MPPVMQLENKVISLQQLYVAAMVNGIPVVTAPLNRKPLVNESGQVFGYIEDAHSLDVPLAEFSHLMLGTNGRAPYRPLTQMPELGSRLELGVYSPAENGSQRLVGRIAGDGKRIFIEPAGTYCTRNT